jgi:hypothetical protein
VHKAHLKASHVTLNVSLISSGAAMLLAPPEPGANSCSYHADVAPPYYRLLPHRPTLAKYMAPFVLWELVVVVIYAISFIKLETVQEAIVALATGNRVVYRTSRVRLFCNLLVLADTEDEVSVKEPCAHVTSHSNYTDSVPVASMCTARSFSSCQMYAMLANCSQGVICNNYASPEPFATLPAENLRS